jgi:para-nitrobenzyl esterase
VPLVIGTARDEGALHVALYDQVSSDELAWFVRTTFGDAAVAPVLGRYPLAPKAALSKVVTDGIFRCNSRRAARLVAARGVPVYLYEWAHALNGPPKVHALGPTHGIDENFLFDATTDGIGPDPTERPLVELVEDTWGQFMATGDPGHGWPRYTAEGDAHFVLDLAPHEDRGLDRASCDFWDTLGRP